MTASIAIQRRRSLKAMLPKWAQRRVRASWRKTLPPSSMLTASSRLIEIWPVVADGAKCQACGSWLTVADLGWICSSAKCLASPIVSHEALERRLKQIFEERRTDLPRVLARWGFGHVIDRMIQLSYWRMKRPDLVGRSTPRRRKRRTNRTEAVTNSLE